MRLCAGRAARCSRRLHRSGWRQWRACPSRSAPGLGWRRSGSARVRRAAGYSPSGIARRRRPRVPRRPALRPQSCENRASARSDGAVRPRISVIGSSRSSSELTRPLASREALTYRAARRIATRATPRANLDANLGGSLAEPTMLWPFNHFRKPRLAPRRTIEAIYGMIVTQAREPLFYRDLGVPDTVNGRFDLLLMHLWLVLRRLKAVKAGSVLSQQLFDHFCIDMDDNLREMGVGDLTVPKRMQAFGEAFYGRTAAYDFALTEGREALAQAMCKNILNGEKIEQARRLAAYAEVVMTALAGEGEVALMSGTFRFPSPGQADVKA